MRRKKDNRSLRFSDFYCTKCGRKNIPIIRQVGKEREPGHLKKLYCLYCNTEENMVEIKNNGKYTLEHFLAEYNYGNFENGERKVPYRQFIAELKKEGLVTCL